MKFTDSYKSFAVVVNGEPRGKQQDGWGFLFTGWENSWFCLDGV
jgi:hypothetical protein